MSYGINAPQGLVPVNTLLAATFTEATNPNAKILSDYGSNIGTYDLVALDTNGTIVRSTGATGTAGTNVNVGVFMGWRGTTTQPTQTSLNLPLVKQPGWVAHTLVQGGYADAWVLMDPWVIYSIQVFSGQATQANVGSTAILESTLGGGMNSQGYSRSALGTINQAAGNPLKIVGIDETVGNREATAYNNYLVMLNDCFWKVGSAGV